MAELDPNAAIQNTPQTGEPGSTQTFDWESDENPYKKSFQDYRVEADRRQTKLSTYEGHLEDLRSSDLERQRAAAQALGIELVEDEPVYDDPTDELKAQMAQLRAEQVALAQAREADKADLARERAEAMIEARLESMSLDESDKDWVLARAVALGAAEDGLPNLKAAYDQLVARDEAVMAKWAKRKGTTSIAPGSTGTDAKNIMEMTDSERVDWATQRIESGT